MRHVALWIACSLLASFAAADGMLNLELLEADWREADEVYTQALPREERMSFSVAHIQEVVDRGRALAARLIANGADPRVIEPHLKELRDIEAGLGGLDPDPSDRKLERQIAYLNARNLARHIAFANPLFNFDRLLFIKRHDAVGVFHMVDQYYGFNAVPGGGLFVLENPFGANPTVTNLLEDSVVEAGRLSGKALASGAFLSPELSFDGRTILFAYTEAQGADLEWTPTSSYHIFRVNADGTGLTQLTDGSWNDFDPCLLPGGRVVFVSERRGGYLRCGRHCPTYALFSMKPDGSDIRNFSYHETHEWHPSVDNDGMVVYTRWDYVDRDTNVAHHIWISYPDGSDPRSFHGNYPIRREGRPWMEMSIRAIPGSHKYVAATGAHHGHAFGSLVLIDPRIQDDGAMAQLTRLTPDAPFPEAEAEEKPAMVYGTPWPLSEEDYLCVYGADAKNRGIYWIDAFGNRELLYRDPAISCLSPIPFRPRPTPPALPDTTTPEAKDAPATIAVMNVYESDFEWPEDTRITGLRIIQVLPKTTPSPNVPRIGVADQTNARAILGTVPVEADGSAYFEAPTGKLLYFQALDDTGMAVQSMRSGTYVQPGGQLTCRGCHEPKHQTAPTPATPPAAFRRPPSPITPEVDGTNPFNYVRLVQPVLDRHCVECHDTKDASSLVGKPGAENGWTQSYASLAKDYGFYFNVRNGSINDGVHGGVRTTAGEFGAKAAPLLSYLDEDHYGVDLPEEDFHRLALWLDANSEFYGAYEKIEAQARGEIVQPSLE